MDEVRTVFEDIRFTDFGNAKRFVRQNREIVRYCPEWKQWLVFREGIWEKNPRHHLWELAKSTILTLYKEAASELLSIGDREELLKHAKRSSSPSRIKSMLELAQSDPEILINAQQLDADPWLLNCQNGTLNLRTGDLSEHNSNDFLTKKAAPLYDQSAGCPVFTDFISSICGDNTSRVAFLKRVIGYSLTGFTTEQCFFVLYGRGANGKSTLVETIGLLMGDYAMNTPSETLLSQHSSTIRNDIARLANARFVSAAEVDHGRYLNEAKIKEVTGEYQVTARFLYREFFTFTPIFKLFLTVNHLPEISGTDDGIWRRVIVVPFDFSIPAEEMDKDLPIKLQGELPGILNWALAGCREWQNQGLAVPAELTAIRDRYRKDSDAVGEFMEDKCKFGPEKRVPLGLLYCAYLEWADEACQEATGKKTFGALMKQRGYRQRKSDRTRYWDGIALVKKE
ncbi:MAG: hypothetical protein HN416_14685 [Nitrospina sp.]|jgi:putative DNA primase/helicase|nr:hypothetical protein [Nitrospina sp.]